jgi:hypothetical protein
MVKEGDGNMSKDLLFEGNWVKIIIQEQKVYGWYIFPPPHSSSKKQLNKESLDWGRERAPLLCKGVTNIHFLAL